MDPYSLLDEIPRDESRDLRPDFIVAKLCNCKVVFIVSERAPSPALYPDFNCYIHGRL